MSKMLYLKKNLRSSIPNEKLLIMKKEQTTKSQKIIVFQQNGSGENKIRGILKYGGNLFRINTISVDENLPAVIDDATQYLPDDIRADVVLDYLQHPDLSYDLAIMCRDRNIPVVVSGKKVRVKGALSPPT
jgi:thymidylate synthase